MFKLSITGEVNGKSVKLTPGRRYIIIYSDNMTEKLYEGIYLTYKDNILFLKTVDGSYLINFDCIEDIQEL